MKLTIKQFSLSQQIASVHSMSYAVPALTYFYREDLVANIKQILKNGIPDKGALLTQLTAHWFSVLTSRIPNLRTHLITLDLPSVIAGNAQARGRSMQVRKLKVLPIESIVRGYITGSAWSEYKKTGTMHGEKIQEGLRECEKLPKPVWTPSTKAELGDKDENISAARAAEIVGQEYADKIAELSLQVYQTARDYAAERGIIIADTKFEFGLDESTTPPSVVLIDEVLTPDSSRFWDASKYEVGRSQDSLDKQPLRDWLTANGLKDKQGAEMPADVVARTRARYIEAYERLTGTKWQSVGGLKVLLVGNGGREHALAWKLSQANSVDQIFVCPGNGGTGSLPKTMNLGTVSPSSFPDLAKFAKENDIDLLIPGPEQPLVDGIVDYFAEHVPGVKAFGPSRKAAHMEGSKTFSKDFMKRHNIPTAVYENFKDFAAASKYLDSINHNVVIKASGLAAGKGVIIPTTKEEAHAALQEIMNDKAFGEAGDEVVIEEFLEGHEISILSFSDGTHIKSLPPAQDHKRIFDDDQGPNTGGMGTYAPAPTKIVTSEILKEIEEKSIRPTIDGMKQEGIPFIGCLFSGFMITKDGPKVLEYNVRFGDPETQSLLSLLESDLGEIMLACAQGNLANVDVKVSSKSAATVVVAAGGYPGSYKKGVEMKLDSVPYGKFSSPKLSHLRWC
jgi:phosphoribosylaminoimidazole-succinocarboxamide synthase